MPGVAGVEGLLGALLISCLTLGTPPASPLAPAMPMAAAPAHRAQALHHLRYLTLTTAGPGRRGGNNVSNATALDTNSSNVTYYETSAPFTTQTSAPSFAQTPPPSPPPACPSPAGLVCSGNGECQGIACTCKAGFSGADCAQRDAAGAESTAPQGRVRIIIKVALPLGREEFEKSRAAYAAAVAAAARVQTSAVEIVAVRDAARRRPPGGHRSREASRMRRADHQGVVVETRILVADASAANLVTKDALDAQLAENGLPRSTGFEKTVEGASSAARDSEDPNWIMQGWNLVIVVVPAGSCLGLMLGGCIFLHFRRRQQSNKVVCVLA